MPASTLIPFKRIDVVTAIGLGQVAIGGVEIPLALGGTGIIARRGCGIHAELSHEAGADVVVVEIAAEAELLQLDLVRAKYFARSADRVVYRSVEVVGIGNIGADLRREEFRIESCFFGARVAVQPGPVPVGKGIDLFFFRGRGFGSLTREDGLGEDGLAGGANHPAMPAVTGAALVAAGEAAEVRRRHGGNVWPWSSPRGRR